MEIRVTLKYAVSWCLRAGLMSPQAQGNNAPVIRPLPFLEPVQGLPLCLAWSAPAPWLPHSSAPAFGAPLSSSHLPNPSHCRGSALPLPHQLLHGPSHAWDPSHPPQTGSWLKCHLRREVFPACPLWRGHPTHATASPSLLFAVLFTTWDDGLCLLLYLFTVRWSRQSLPGWTFMRAGTLFILLTPVVLEHGTVSTSFWWRIWQTSCKIHSRKCKQKYQTFAE